MTHPYGYAGSVLRVNLTHGTCTPEALDTAVARQFIGGAGYAAHVLFTELQPHIDPLGLDNKLLLLSGPLSDNRVPGGGSIMACFKSPLTGLWGQSRCGGNAGPDLRRAGFDLVIIEGKSSIPQYLEIAEGQGLLHDASPLVGKDVYEKDDWLKAHYSALSGRTNVLCIGPAGERLVRFASIMHRDRAAGRAGGGAVMGSKNLLGVVIRGTQTVTLADARQFTAAVRESLRVVRASDACQGFHRFGTVGDLAANDADGDWPTKNWQSNNWGKGEQLLDHFQERNFLRPHACYTGCPIACGRMAHVDGGPFSTPEHEGAEYETISVFTAYTMNANMDAAVHCGYLCNKYGLDTISTGALMAFVMECFEHALVSKDDLEGLEPRWGDEASMTALITLIVERRGMGRLFGEGVRQAAAVIGNGAEAFAVHVKGLEGPAHDPRSGKALGITYATGSRGMCHIQPLEGMTYDRGKVDWGMTAYGVRDPQTLDRWDEQGKGKDVAILQNGLSLPDMLGTCKFMCYAGITPEHWADMLNAACGWSVTGADLVRAGERAANLQRLFNMREGAGRKDDTLPQRVLQIPGFGAYAHEPRCVISDTDALLDEYYATRGWERTSGNPSRETLAALGLEAYGASCGI